VRIIGQVVLVFSRSSLDAQTWRLSSGIFLSTSKISLVFSLVLQACDVGIQRNSPVSVR